MTDTAAPQRPLLGSDVIATLAVAAFSIAVAIGFARVFSGWPFLSDMAVIVVAGHGFGLLVRRLRVPSWIAVPVAAVVLGWTVLAVFYPDTFSWALPTSDTWSILRLELTSVREQFRVAIAPVNYGGGWDVLAGIGLATVVLLSDVFAFRAFARAETLVPGGVLFVFIGALGDQRLRVGSTVILVFVGVIVTIVLRSYHSPTTGRFATATGMSKRWPIAISLGACIALLAGFVGPRLPGADAAALYDTTGRRGTVTDFISPLVDIRSRLTNRSDTELFRVRSDAESYWRSSTLPDFDGTRWSLPETTISSSPDQTGPITDGAVDNRQHITIGALRGSLVPAASSPYRASGRADLRWVPESSTLVTIDGDLDQGDEFDIQSSSPRLDPEILAAATSNDPGDPIYTELPDDLPGVVADTANAVTAGSRSTYESARLTQAWFQREFDYSLEVQSGHGNNAIENFLRDKVGYCEQFAGTFAAMMRTLGIPARVAVGFTSGTRLADGEFSVRGRNAHAWPEVWFDGIGWVSFEPTPGRGAANTESYTGVPPQQDTTTGEGAVGDALTDAPPPTVSAGRLPDGGLILPDEFTDPTGADASPRPTPVGDDSGGAWRWLLALAAVAGVAAVPELVRRFRHAQLSGHTAYRQIATAWSQSISAVSAAGMTIDASDTPLETAARVTQSFPMVARPITSLATTVTEAAYAEHGREGFEVIGRYGSSIAGECRNWSKQIDHAVTSTLSWQQRLRRYVTVWT